MIDMGNITLNKVLQAMATQGNFSIELIPLSADIPSMDAKAAHPDSTQTQAIWDIVNNPAASEQAGVIGDQWVTDSRLQMTPFVKSVWTERFTLFGLGKKSNQIDSLGMLTIVDTRAMILLVCASMLFSLLYQVYEGKQSDDFRNDAGCVSNQLSSLIVNISSLMKGKITASPSTIPGRLLIIGQAVTVFFVFTFQLTSLVNKFTVAETKGQCLDIDCITENKERVLTSSVIQDNVNKLYPVLYKQNLLFESSQMNDKATINSDQFENNTWKMEVYFNNLGILKGDVHAQIGINNDVNNNYLASCDFGDYMIKEGIDHKFCQQIYPNTGELFSIQIGFPVREKQHPKLSQILQKLIENGTINDILNDAINDSKVESLLNTGQSFCVADNKQILFTQLEISSMQGLIALVSIIIILSLLQYFIFNSDTTNELSQIMASTGIRIKSKLKKTVNKRASNIKLGLRANLGSTLGKLDNQDKYFQDELDEPEMNQNEMFDQELFKINAMNHNFYLKTHQSEYFDLKAKVEVRTLKYEDIAMSQALEVQIENAGNHQIIDDSRFVNHQKMSERSFEIFKELDLNFYEAQENYKIYTKN